MSDAIQAKAPIVSKSTAQEPEPAPAQEDEIIFPPVNRIDPQLTLRAVLTGMVLGSVLSLCNIYAGLKIGWGFNMSVTAALASFGFWKVMEQTGKSGPWGLLENNINQTAASSAASISSAGLVSAIPALVYLTDTTLSWAVIAAFTFSVSMVGVVVAVGLRRQMLVVDKLPFPNGIATAETVKEMYAHGAEAIARVKMLLGGGLFGAAMKLAIHFLKISKWAPALSMPTTAGGKLASAGIATISLKNLSFALNPSPLMVAVGAIIGPRAGLSMLIGAIISFGFLAPVALENGWAEFGKNNVDAMWWGSINKWMLWPGVAMMVTASLTSFAFSWRSIVNAIRGSRVAEDGENGGNTHEVPRKFFLGGLGLALVLATVAQITFFDIAWWVAILAVLFTFVLAVVAGRVSGETGITPVGPMGKVTQLVFGVIAPGNVAANLMTANVTGGAASQCGDMLHDLKTGAMIGASPRYQAAAQVFGVMAGALAGSAGYLLLMPDPKGMLFTDEWPAPAAAAWKAVAEVFSVGIEAMPPMAAEAMAIAGALGIILAIVEKRVPKEGLRFIPSPASIGLAMVIPAFYAISMALGGVLSVIAKKVTPTWTKRFWIVLAAGIIAGESLAGVGLAIQNAMEYIAAQP